MDDLPQRRGFVIAAVVVIVGLFVAAVGAIRTEPALFWGGLVAAGVAFVLGRPTDPEAAIDDRAEASDDGAAGTGDRAAEFERS